MKKMKFHLSKRNYLIAIGVIVVIGAILIAIFGCVGCADNSGVPSGDQQNPNNGNSLIPGQQNNQQWVDAPTGYSGKPYASYEVVDLRTNK